MVLQENHGININVGVPSSPHNRTHRSWESKITKKLSAPSSLGKFRPAVGQCCHRCNPDSLHGFGQSFPLGFRNLLRMDETHTRFRGWLVRRLRCVLFMSGCRVHPSPARRRTERVCHDDRCVGWVLLKMLSGVFAGVQVDLSHLPALRRASKEGSLLIYVHARQSAVDCALIPLVLLCHNLRVPYTLCPVPVRTTLLRWVLQRTGVVLLPRSALAEQEAETDRLYSALMTALIPELLREGQDLSLGVSGQPGGGGRWLARITRLIREGAVADVSLVPVGISYDRVPLTDTQIGFGSVFRWLFSRLRRKPEGSVRIHFARPFSLKEMCESGRCRIDEWRPLQDLLLPVVTDSSAVGRRRTSWLLPSHYGSEITEAAHSERDLSIAIISHLIFSTTSCMAVMSTGLLSSLLLHKRKKGVSLSVLCRDVAWLTEELLLRNKDVGFGGGLEDVVLHSLSLLAPELIIAKLPSREHSFIFPRPSLAATLKLHRLAQVVTHAFILEAVGACAVSAMLCEAAGGGGKTDAVEGDGVEGHAEFDPVLSHDELMERTLQLCQLLPPGFIPPCQTPQCFALDAVDSLLCCGILILEEVPRPAPICDSWQRDDVLKWTAADDPDLGDSDSQRDRRSYKISRPSQCPEMLLYLCSMLAGHLRSLCWTAAALDHEHTPLPEAELVDQIRSHLCNKANEKKRHFESCSEEAARAAVRTLIDLDVLSEERREGDAVLNVSSLFQLPENREKLRRFISQFLYS